LSLGYAPGTWNITQDFQSNSTPSINAWHHFALVFTGSAYVVYVDGVEEIRVTSSQPLPNFTLNNITFGVNPFATSETMNGYLDEFRFSKIVRYSAEFTPATSAFSIDLDTLSLCHFDASVSAYVDLNAIEEVKSVPGAFTASTYLRPNSAVSWGCLTNSHVSTTIAKFGTSSLWVPYINSTRAGAAFGATISNPAQWTVEMWYNASTIDSNGSNMFTLSTYANTAGVPLQIYINPTQLGVMVSTNGVNQNATGTGTIVVTAGIWNHIAVVFDGNAYLGFFNGALVMTFVAGTIYQENAFKQGLLGQGFWDTTRITNGYFDEFRLSKVARYLAAFTPQTAPFVWDSDTVSLNHFETNMDVECRTDAGVVESVLQIWKWISGDRSLESVCGILPTVDSDVMDH
jgi:hypothetical protein